MVTYKTQNHVLMLWEKSFPSIVFNGKIKQSMDNKGCVSEGDSLVWVRSAPQ